MSDARPWVAYVGPFAFPEGGAAARRVLGNAKALAAAGYDTVILSGQQAAAGREAYNVAPGIRCVSMNERNAEHLPRALRYIRYALMGARTRKWLAAQPMQPAAVILYSGYSPYLLQLNGWARGQGVPLMFDAVEWYTAPSAAGFLLSPYLWNTELAMRVLVPRLDGVITISRALERYYAARDIPVGRVPPLFDAAEISAVRRAPDPQRRLRLAYAGSPGQKDLLEETIEAVIARDAAGARIVLDIAGLSEEELRQRSPVRAGGRLPSCIRLHGRLTHAQALNIVGSADFTLLLRPVDRVSTSGFPTKFVESLAVGTPVIANITSDLADHLSDGKTGFVCPEPTQVALQATLEKAVALPPRGREAMRKAARAEAEQAFGYENHAGTLAGLIKAAGKNKYRKRDEI